MNSDTHASPRALAANARVVNLAASLAVVIEATTGTVLAASQKTSTAVEFARVQNAASPGARFTILDAATGRTLAGPGKIGKSNGKTARRRAAIGGEQRVGTRARAAAPVSVRHA